MTGFAQKVLKVSSDDLWQEIFLTQRRKGAKKTPRNAVALCAFAPLREKSSSHKSAETSQIKLNPFFVIANDDHKCQRSHHVVEEGDIARLRK